MKTTTKIASLALALTALSSLGSAQMFVAKRTFDIRKSGGYGKRYGNDWLGGSYSAGTTFRARYDGRSGSASGGVYGSAYVNFLKKRAEAARGSAFASASVSRSRRYASGSVFLRLAGRTVLNHRFSSSLTLGQRQWTRNLFATDPLIGVSIGGKNFGIFGNVGVGLKRSLTMQLRSGSSIGVSGYLEAWGYGRADVDLWIAGVTAKVTLARTRIAAYGTADLAGRLRLLINLTVQAIRLKLKGYVNLGFTKPGKTFVNVSFGYLFRQLLRFGM